MGNCVKCYPCIIKNNLPEEQSVIDISPIINDLEKTKQNNNNNLVIDNFQKRETKQIYNLNEIMNYEPSSEKDNFESKSPKNKIGNNNLIKKHQNLLHLNNDNNQRRRKSLLSEHIIKINNKYNKLKSFSRKISIESSLRANSKSGGDIIIENNLTHLVQNQIFPGIEG